jgi:hypothetical protein
VYCDRSGFVDARPSLGRLLIVSYCYSEGLEDDQTSEDTPDWERPRVPFWEGNLVGKGKLSSLTLRTRITFLGWLLERREAP